MVALVLAQASRGVAVVAENDGLVVQGHPGDGVRPPAGAGRSGAPGVSAEQLGRGAARGQGGGQVGVGDGGSAHRPSARAGADGRRQADAPGQLK